MIRAVIKHTSVLAIGGLVDSDICSFPLVYASCDVPYTLTAIRFTAKYVNFFPDNKGISEYRVLISTTAQY
jgi:hypothetical protein